MTWRKGPKSLQAVKAEKRAEAVTNRADFVFRGQKTEKKNSFFRNKARKLLKAKDGCGKNSQNKPETNLKQSYRSC
jgi:hypothetical protein